MTQSEAVAFRKARPDPFVGARLYEDTARTMEGLSAADRKTRSSANACAFYKDDAAAHQVFVSGRWAESIRMTRRIAGRYALGARGA